ncbi:MAG: squalene--hopene cyclase, partial [Gammaproteobacteria bacterium]
MNARNDLLDTAEEARPDAGYELGRAPLEHAVERARAGLERLQKEDGHWVFELEADCTIPAEYVLMMHFMDEIDSGLEQRIAVFLRSHQAEHGGWPLYAGGDF